MPGLTVDAVRCVRGERLVLNCISAELGAGDALLLTGPNGSGKSTLLRLLAGLLRPEEGAIRWDDEDIAHDPAAHHTRTVYVGHADAVKPTLSVLENVAFWFDLAGKRGRMPLEAMELLGIGHLADLPGRYLSAGQRRRVSLTRMLTSGASLWLLDEPTTSLDAATTDVLAECIRAHRNAGGMLAVSTHSDMGLANPVSLNLGAS